MKCPSEVELNEFAEDRLDSRRRWEIQEHLEECARCCADHEGLNWITGCLGVIDTADETGGEHPADADLAALAEGRIAPDLKAELLSHLSVCAECARVFGSLPRKAERAGVSRSFYSFAAAAVLMIAIGVAAFTGQFASVGKLAGPRIASEIATEKTVESKPAPSTEDRSLPPTVVAQPAATPEPEPAAGVSKPAAAALAMKTSPSRQTRFARRSTSSRRGDSDSLNDTRIAMAQQPVMPKTFFDMGKAAAAEGISTPKRFRPIDETPTAPRPAPPSAAGAVAVGGVGSGSFSAASVPSAPGRPDTAVMQRAETKSQMIQQSPQPQRAAKKKTVVKSAAKVSQTGGGKPKQELRKTGASADNSGKSRLKSTAADGADGTKSGRNSGQGQPDHSKGLTSQGQGDPGQSSPGSHNA